jgi:hypothetical protein
MTDRKAAIVAALHRWINQRPGLEYGNYGHPAPYRAEVRSIGKDLTHARALLREVELSSISADALIAAASGSFSGRLTIICTDDGIARIDYCTGQYWPTEYRRAVCAVLSAALYNHWSRDADGKWIGGDAARKAARNAFGRGIASRWFS